MLEIRASGSPPAEEADDGLARLQGIVNGLFGNTVLEDVETDEGLEMDTDTRYLVFASAPLLFSMPESPKNGARLVVQDMLGAFATYPLTIEATPANIVLDAPGTYGLVYIADSATWAGISPLTLDSVLPLNDDEFFWLELAEAIAPMFGAALTPESQNRLTRARARIRARFEVSRDENGAEYF
jgi:hypothetical protein